MMDHLKTSDRTMLEMGQLSIIIIDGQVLIDHVIG